MLGSTLFLEGFRGLGFLFAFVLYVVFRLLLGVLCVLVLFGVVLLVVWGIFWLFFFSFCFRCFTFVLRKPVPWKGLIAILKGSS